MKKNKILITAMLTCLVIPAGAQQAESDTAKACKWGQGVDVGATRTFSRRESTAAVSTVYNDEFNKRGAKDISNSLFGQGAGLVTLQNAGNYAAVEPTFYVRGLQSLSSSSPLILVDGLERDMNLVSPEEVESVSILKDAAAVALYGYKGVNGAILITTKRGAYNTKKVTLTYDHVSNFMVRRPGFADAYTYAQAVNEARGYEGLDNRYTSDELNAFRTGAFPYLYPNVDWVDETFKNQGISNRYTIEFSGGGSKFRYYTMLNLVTDNGFVQSPNENEGYSTQNKYSKGNLRTNLDIDLTPTTKLKLNLLGTLYESSRAGDSANLWDLVYSLPSAAFPARTETGLWGGNATWAGTSNPVAQSQGAAYSKGHTRNLYTDLTVQQDLSGFLKGLGANIRLAYDNQSTVWENHSKEFEYGSTTVGAWVDGMPTIAGQYTGGKVGEMGEGASLEAYARQFNFSGGLDYTNSFGKHDVYSQLRWEYEFRDSYGLNTTVYRQNLSWYTHYGFNKRYYADLALVSSGSSLLAPGRKWAFSPTVSAAWVLSEENFLRGAAWLNWLKLRASFGIINADYLPKDEDDNTVFNYWDQLYETSGVTYPFNSGYNSDFGSTAIGRLATINSSHEKAYKYNIGLDATLWKSLNVTVDAYYQNRKDIWVASSGKYTDVLGLDAPFENAGIVRSYGVEASIDYTKTLGGVTFNVGGNFSLNKNKIVDQLEEARLYEYLKTTGHPLEQIYGLQAVGFFGSTEEIAVSPVQSFGTVRPGDIKYKDQNGDFVIDANDKVAIGYTTTAPEMYYSFRFGAEWRGLGFDAMFQGTGNYSAILNTKSMFWPLINNTTLSKHYYENRWTPENPDARYPRLSSQSNANNYQTSTVWVANRAFLKLRHVELYYKFPKALMRSAGLLSNLKLYVRGVDLLCFDTLDVVDPESYGATNPLNKSVVVGLSVGF
jgi:TonB-linked SusC/RagA family outer membrane protein